MATNRYFADFPVLFSARYCVFHSLSTGDSQLVRSDSHKGGPARSTSVALFADGPALAQLWLFWVAPFIGAVIAGIAYKAMFGDD